MKDLRKMTTEELIKEHKELATQIDKCKDLEKQQRLINKSLYIGQELDRRWAEEEIKELEEMGHLR